MSNISIKVYINSLRYPGYSDNLTIYYFSKIINGKMIPWSTPLHKINKNNRPLYTIFVRILYIKFARENFIDMINRREVINQGYRLSSLVNYDKS